MATITVNSTLTHDQTSGTQDDDNVLVTFNGTDLDGLPDAFETFLNGLPGAFLTDAGKTYAADVEAATSVSDPAFVTVNDVGDDTNINALFFSDPNGDAFDGDQVFLDYPTNSDPMLTVDGAMIFLHSFMNGQIVLATTSATVNSGEVVAAFYLDPATDLLSAQVTMISFIALDHPVNPNPDDSIDFSSLLNITATGTLSFDFDNLDSGNFLHVTVGSGDAGLMVSGLQPVIKPSGDINKQASDTVNTSQGGEGATIGVNNQMFVPGETAVFSLVEGQAPGTYTDIGTLDYDDFIDVNDATAFISQVQGNPTTNFTLKVSTFSAGGANTNPEEGISYIDNNLANGSNLGTDGDGENALKDDTPVIITSVIVRDENDVDVTGSLNVNGIGTGMVTVDGLDALYTVQWFTSDTFNRFHIEAIEGKFDIGRIDISEGLELTTPVGDNLIVDDDGPSIVADGTAPPLTVDDSDFATDASGDFSVVFTPTFGNDGFKDTDDDDAEDADAVTYALGVSAAGGVDSGLVDTLSGNKIFLFLEGGEVVGRVGTDGGAADGSGAVAFDISVVTNTGVVTLDQSRSVVHDDPTDPDEAGTSAAMLSAAGLVTLTATITDGDLDTNTATANIGSAFKFKDDGPSIVADGTAPPLTVDDSDFATDASGDFSVVFTPTFGNDGFKDTDDDDAEDADAVTYALGVSAAGGVDSGLVDTLSGNKIFLFLEGGEVVGRVGTDGGAADGSGAVAFDISVVTNTGVVTLDQSRSVVHDDPTDPDEAGTSAAMLSAAGLVTLTATITDGDLDTNTATANIGSAFKFKDDGPSIVADGTAPPLTVDDSDFATDASGDFSVVFTPTFGNDGFKDTDDDDAEDADAVTYALGVSAAGGVDSGLVDTLSGNKIFLFLEGGEVVGRVGTDGGAADGSGAVAFDISVVTNTGVVTLDQSRSVVHDDPTDPDEAGTSAAMLSAAGLVTLTATITDGDLDTNTATANIGSAFKFKDDGPSIVADGTAPPLTVDDSDFATDASGDFSVVFTPTFGNDGFKDTDDDDAEDADAVTYALGVSAAGGVDSGLVDTLSGNKIFLFLEGGEVVGRVGTDGGAADGSGAVAFDISVVTNTGVVTLDQSRSVVHDDPTDPDEAGTSAAMLSAAGLVTLTATITDGDLDTNTATANIGSAFKFKDDGPSIVADGTAPPLTVDDSDFATDASGDFSVVFTPTFGNDGFKDTDDDDAEDADAVTYALGVSAAGGVDSGLVDTLSGNKIFLFLEGGEVVGRVGTDGGAADGSGAVAFDISVVTNTGVVTLDQSRSVVHDDPTDPDEAGTSAAMLSAAGLVTLTATITDGDLDTNTATANIGSAFKFKDDGPSIVADGTAPPLTVDDSDFATDASGDFSVVFTPTFGNDGFKDTDDDDAEDADAVTYALGVSAAGGVDSGLVDTLSGNKIFLFLEGGEVVGRVGTDGGAADGSGAVAFDISVVTNTGVVTLDQSRSVVHDDPTDPDEAGTSAAMLSAAGLVTLTATITDGDLDTNTATANIGSAFKFKDDGPTAGISRTAIIVVHDESAGEQTGGIAVGGEDNDDDDQPLSLVPNDGDPYDNLPAAFLPSVLLPVPGDVLGWAMSSGAVVDTSSTAFGADGDGGTLLSLTLSGEGANSDLFVLSGAGISLYTASGLVVGRVNDISGGTPGTADPTGAIAFAVMINQDGTVSTAQYLELKNPDGTDPDDQVQIKDGVLFAKNTATDGDGDSHMATVDLGSAIRFEDDGPTPIGSGTPGTVEEDDLPEGNDEDGSGNNDSASNDLTTVLDPGVDEPVDWGLVFFETQQDLDDAIADPTSSLNTLEGLTSKGDTLTYSIAYDQAFGTDGKADVLTATAGGRTIFTFTLVTVTDTGTNPDTVAGTTILKIEDQTDHAAGNGENFLSIDLDDLLDVRDADTDPVPLPGQAEYNIQDDVPTIGPIANILVDYAAGDFGTAALNDSVGTDEDPSFDIIAYTGDDEAVIINGVTLVAEKASDTLIRYYEESGVNTGFQDGEDTLYYTYELIDTGADGIVDTAKFTVHDDPPPADLNFDLNVLPSGQNLFGLIAGTVPGDPTINPDGASLIIIGRDVDLKPDGTFSNTSDTINTSKGGGPTTIGNSNQMIDGLSNKDPDGEGIFFAYVDDPVDTFVSGIEGGLDQNEADDANNIQYDGGTVEVDSAFFSIAQVQGNELASLTISAYDVAGSGLQGTAFANNPIASSTQVEVTAVRVFDGDTLVFEDDDTVGTGPELETLGYSIAVDFTGDTALVSGLDADFRIEFDTDTLHDVSLIEGVGGKFDIGGFGISEPTPTPDQVFEFTVEIEDYDGDKDTDTHFVGIDGTGPNDDNSVVFPPDPDILI